LRQVSLFSEIKDLPHALETLAATMKFCAFRKSQALITEGETGAEMYFLLDGQVAIHKSTPEGDKFAVATLSAEQRPFFGEGAMLDEDARSATIIAESECNCMVLSRPDFEDFCRKHPNWALPVLQKIARVVNGRLRKSNNDFIVLYNALVKEIRGM